MIQNRYHNFIFLRLNEKWRNTPRRELSAWKEEFLATIGSLSGAETSLFSTLGLKKDTAIMLWVRGTSFSTLEKTVTALFRTQLFACFDISHTLFGIVRKSPYASKKDTPPRSEMAERPASRYLIVYPFTKTHSWYALPFAERKEIMKEHILCGLSHKGVRQLLLYSIGVDDHEFTVAYETNSLERFQDLVMDLRSTKSRAYTRSDTPLFLSVRKSAKQILKML